MKMKRLVQKNRVQKGSGVGVNLTPIVSTGIPAVVLFLAILSLRRQGVPENVIQNVREDIETATAESSDPDNSSRSSSPQSSSVETQSLVDAFDLWSGITGLNGSSDASSSTRSSPTSFQMNADSSRPPSPTSKGVGMKINQSNKWIDHVRKFAKTHNMTYFQALKDPKCKMSYKK